MTNIIRTTIPKYVFVGDSNPYAFNANSPKSLSEIASKIEHTIKDNLNTQNTLIRGIQSGYHKKISRDELINLILKNGQDTYDDNADMSGIIHAVPFEDGVVEQILSGFHVYKPKCEELPQYPVDIWMVFDANAYENVEYIHPRHHVLTRDRWKLKPKTVDGLKGIFIVS